MALKKKRRKRKKYRTGVYKSIKCATPIHYRSGWELTVCKYLDISKDVLSYEYESFGIKYISNSKTGKLRVYYPDFLVTYQNGNKILVEVKRKDKLSDVLVLKKAKAAEEWCAKQNPPIRYEFWTNNMIEAFKKIVQVTLQRPRIQKK
jgi:hypothetical protein